MKLLLVFLLAFMHSVNALATAQSPDKLLGRTSTELGLDEFLHLEANETFTRTFPGGAGRLCVRAEGYAATLVNGVVVTEQGEHTGARPGRVVRPTR